MNLRACPFEPEIRRLLELGHWPQSCPPELRAHAESCCACGELILVTQTFRNVRAASPMPLQLPPPGVLWWRAQLRRRNAAVERINKPIVGAQIFALGVTLIAAAGYVVMQGKQSVHWLSSLGIGMQGWIGSVSQSPVFHLESLWSSSIFKSSSSLVYLIPILVILAMFSGVVAYMASEKQ